MKDRDLQRILSKLARGEAPGHPVHAAHDALTRLMDGTAEARDRDEASARARSHPEWGQALRAAEAIPEDVRAAAVARILTEALGPRRVPMDAGSSSGPKSARRTRLRRSVRVVAGGIAAALTAAAASALWLSTPALAPLPDYSYSLGSERTPSGVLTWPTDGFGRPLQAPRGSWGLVVLTPSEPVRGPLFVTARTEGPVGQKPIPVRTEVSEHGAIRLRLLDPNQWNEASAVILTVRREEAPTEDATCGVGDCLQVRIPVSQTDPKKSRDP